MDISGCGFTSAPIVSSSLAGSSSHWQATGGSYQYDITATVFRVYVYRPGITPAQATDWDWKIGWIAEPTPPPYTFTTKASLRTAVQAYNTDPTAAIATYNGP